MYYIYPIFIDYEISMQSELDIHNSYQLPLQALKIATITGIADIANIPGKNSILGIKRLALP